jgi:DNA-binding Xre family transcriptional regulator
MKKRSISQYALINQGIDKHTLDQLRKNQNVTVLTIEKLCDILDCTPNDVFSFKKEAD